MIACSTSVRYRSPLADALAQIAGAGFDKVDLLVIDGWAHVNTRDLEANYDETVGQIDSLLAQYKLMPIAFNTAVSAQLHQRSADVNARRAQEVEALIRAMRHYDVTIGAIQPRDSDPTRPWDDVLSDCVETLREQIAAGADQGVTFALELHVRSPFETLEQARRLIERMPELPLVYDPTHFVMQGVDIRQTDDLLRRAKQVHLRDAAKGSLQAPFGQGTVDFDWILGSLRDAGYQGHFSLEYLDTQDFDVFESSCRLRDKIAEYFPD